MVTIKNIIPRKQAENIQSNQYIATNCKCIIDKFTVTNTSGANVTFAANLVAFGDSPTDANLVLKAKTVVPNETYTCPELVGQVLEAGGTISTIAGAATSLTISASGREVT